MITSRLDCGLEIKCYLNRALRKLEKRGRCMDEGGKKDDRREGQDWERKHVRLNRLVNRWAVLILLVCSDRKGM